ncbi:MAG TPA: hypothetical protein VFE62_01985 [Gemmataceae bacterium]|nr:hypothetical protein [Gemmataceae bacterium]
MLTLQGRPRVRVLASFVLIAGILALAGCGRNGRKLHPLRGRVVLPGADVNLLSGSFVEFALATDPSVRSSGVISPDGSFKLETLENGSTRAGIAEGKYQVRIVLANEDSQKRLSAENAVPARYLEFKTSGVIVDVPTKSDVSIECVQQQ